MVQKGLTNFAIKNPKLSMGLCFFVTFIALLAMPNIKRDTEPTHMLDQKNPVITLYNQIKKDFMFTDMIGVGISRVDGKSMFTKDELTKIYKITEEILALKDEKPTLMPIKKLYKKLGVLKNYEENFDSEFFDKEDVVSISTSNDIVVNKNGELLVKPLLPELPEDDKQAENILKLINNNPMLKGKLCSVDGTFVGIFIPIKDSKKERGHVLGAKVRTIIEKYLNPDVENFYYAGFPIAQATFGEQMFFQMIVYAPAAGLVIFLLMFFFFRNLKIIIAPMLVGLMAVIISMGSLIYSGNVVHIMASMIPIFLMPIAVLNSIHILSKLSDKMHLYDSKIELIQHVISELFYPMLYTSLTTMVGFASLTTTGIPPVMVFGTFVAFGVAVAWLLSMVFIPAYTMFLSKKSLESFAERGKHKSSIIESVHFLKNISLKHSYLVILISLIITIVAGLGLPKIIVNDNSVRWFKKDHFIRKADIAFNKNLAGAYIANVLISIPDEVREVDAKEESSDEFDEFNVVEENIPSVRDPQVISYINKIQNFLLNLKDKDDENMVGGVVSIIDVLEKIGDTVLNDKTLPETREKISQFIFLFESGDIKKGRDLWKIINQDPNSKETEMRVFFKTGDNQHMSDVMKSLDDFMKKNPPPFYSKDNKKYPVSVKWSGLLAINNVWQETMVTGMMKALLGSFVIVFFMMVFLFRSFLWGIIAMCPLTMTIVFIYGLIGHLGIFYDMPIAVLSSLTLGLSIDFAIHFIEHLKMFNDKNKDCLKSMEQLFNGTAQAILRNILVISIGFIPLLFASLMPYITVGFFFLLIMFISGFATLILMPAISKVLKSRLKDLKEFN